MIRTPKSPAAAITTLASIGSVLVTAASALTYFPVLPPHLLWLPPVLFTVGGLLGGKALLQRPGDVKAVQ